MAALAPWAAAAKSDLFCDLFAAGVGWWGRGLAVGAGASQAWGHSLFIDFVFFKQFTFGNIWERLFNAQLEM